MQAAGAGGLLLQQPPPPCLHRPGGPLDPPALPSTAPCSQRGALHGPGGALRLEPPPQLLCELGGGQERLRVVGTGDSACHQQLPARRWGLQLSNLHPRICPPTHSSAGRDVRVGGAVPDGGAARVAGRALGRRLPRLHLPPAPLHVGCGGRLRAGSDGVGAWPAGGSALPCTRQRAAAPSGAGRLRARRGLRRSQRCCHRRAASHRLVPSLPPPHLSDNKSGTAGVPPLERSYEERYGGQPAYEQYKAATNLLLPWPPRDKWP